ncbi:MAG TPA: PIN domain-containing protein [Solirubrobacterales bacterium]|nr:PIN domain-containing protein [Solirubrobacterales bacterium]
MLLLDNSAWSRLLIGDLPEDRMEAVLGWLGEGRLAVCLSFLLEAGYSARSAPDHGTLMRRLEQLPRLRVDEAVERVALDAQRELATVGHHRLAPTDLVIAACAHLVGGGVLHYDRDYDLIAEHTRLSFESVWLADAGSL